jgi:transcriptional regulator with XRE-family HTH domain
MLADEPSDQLPSLLATRSTLLGVEPIGRGTPLVEHLGSVVLRTAWRNGLAPGRMIREVAASALGPDENGRFAVRRLEQAFRSGSMGLLGWDVSASTWIDTFEFLTARGGLSELTLRRWAAVLPVRGLIRAERAYCPVHLREWQAAGTPPYEPLLWQIAAVDACAEHGVELETRCPDVGCGATRVGLAASAVTGLCHRCGTPLSQAGARSVASGPEQNAWRVWIAEQLGAVVAAQMDARPADNRIAEAVELAAERMGGSLTALAQRLGVALSTVSLWKDARRQPSLDSLLRLARVAGFELLDVVAGDLRRLRLAELPAKAAWLPDREAPYRDIDWRPIRRALRRAATGSGRESPSAICTRHGVDPAQARRQYPELFVAASARFALTRRQRASIASAGSREAILEAMRQMHTEGTYPSERRTQRRFGRHITYDEFYAVWREGLDELGYRRA